MQIITKNLNDFLEVTAKIKSELGKDEEVWFRGQSNSQYPLLPSLLRYHNGFEKEQTLFKRFRQNAYNLIEKKSNDWETLFDMQHYGVPTRLLDWTDTLGVALFFATYYNLKTGNKSDAAVYVLNPHILNLKSSINHIPFIPADIVLNYKEIYWNKKPFAPNYPIAIEPDYQNDRIKVQTGKFTVHGDNLQPIEELCPTAIKKIILPHSAVEETVKYLKLFNLNTNAIYPDMQGMVEYINDISGLER